MTAKILEVNVRAVLVRPFEVGCNGVQRKHRTILAELVVRHEFAVFAIGRAVEWRRPRSFKASPIAWR